MRISDQEKTNIITSIESFVTDTATLYLHGSRTNDHLKGGDIDLLIITTTQQAELLKNNKHIILAAIKAKLGEQKIDLTIAAETQQQQDPFIEIALEKAVLLKKF